jgi:hypothetical protein
LITSDLYLIVRFNRINLNVPIFNILNAGLGTTEEKEVTDYHFDIVTSFLFVGTLTELLGNISVDY